MNSLENLDDELSFLLSKMKNSDLDASDLEIEDIDQLDLQQLDKIIENYEHKIKVQFNKLSEDAVDPNYAYDSDSGFDLFSIDEVHFPPFERKLVSTGLSFDIPEGYEIQVRTKSGLAINQGLMVLNSPGTVDQGYSGEVKVILMNMNNFATTVTKGQKIAQAVLCPVVSGKWVTLKNTNKLESKDRGNNGFGSTGI
jgi:dUTP pyrophosphatase